MSDQALINWVYGTIIAVLLSPIWFNRDAYGFDALTFFSILGSPGHGTHYVGAPGPDEEINTDEPKFVPRAQRPTDDELDALVRDVIDDTKCGYVAEHIREHPRYTGYPKCGIERVEQEREPARQEPEEETLAPPPEPPKTEKPKQDRRQERQERRQERRQKAKEPPRDLGKGRRDRHYR